MLLDWNQDWERDVMNFSSDFVKLITNLHWICFNLVETGSYYIISAFTIKYVNPEFIGRRVCDGARIIESHTTC